MKLLPCALTVALALATLLTTACSDSALSNKGAYEEADTGWAGADDGWQSDDSGSEEHDPDDLPSENENDFLALRPSNTDAYVFIANPGRDTVTRVHVASLGVDTTAVGDNPSVVATTSDYTTAVIFNKGDDSVSILDADTLDTVTVDVRDDLNAMEMSPDGRWVGLWHDLDVAAEDDEEPDGGVQSFNEFSLVNVTTGQHFASAVGFNPTEVQYTDDSTRCLVISNTFMAVFDLSGDEPAGPTLIQVVDDDELLDPPTAEEVVLDPSGSYALVRQFGASELVIIDLLAESRDTLPVGHNPTDLDLTPDGLHAVAVSRGDKELWIYDTLDPYALPTVLDLPAEVSLGSVLFDPTGNQAILYTTASLTDRYATWDLSTDEIKVRDLVKPISQVAITPSGDTLMVFHTQENATDADPDDPFYDHWALTLLNMDNYIQSNAMLLPGEPTGYANNDAGDIGYFIMDQVPLLTVLDYDSLLDTEVPLKSAPVWVGVLPDIGGPETPPAWVSQEHDLGRISFYHPDDGSLETITGFELNSEIED